MEVFDSWKKNTSMFFVFLIWNCFSATALLSPKGINYEVQALMAVKESLSDVRGILDNWDSNAVDPCSWAMITCSSDNLVISLGAPSQNLSGTLSPRIGNLTNLQVILLQNNNITGKIPEEIRHLSNLRTLDLSNNLLIGRLPFSLSLLPNIQYMRLNNNSFSGALPASFANMTHLSFLDLSYNNLSGPVPELSAKTFSVIGNQLMCRAESEHACYAAVSLPTLMPVNVSNVPPSKQTKAQRRTAAVFGLSVGFLCMTGIGVGFLWRNRNLNRRQRQRSVNGGGGDVEGIHVMTKLGNLRNFQFKELQVSTDHFSSKNLLGKGGFGNVYRGRLRDGVTVAVKRLNDGGAASGAAQFRTEVEMISLAVHRNLLKLYGFCVTSSERLLVYPYMCNGSVASRLRQKPVLDWKTRKKIAVGAARGLLYLHEQCDPKIIHRDVKAANVLLDECYDAVVGDFGLAKLLDHRDTHVTTAVRGTVGHIAPEYLSTGQSSEKTDVYGFGILLVELVTGKRAVEFGKCAMLDWVKKMNEERRFDGMVDRDLKNNYDGIEVEELVRVAILCTQGLPGDRPKMADVVRMLEGDGVAERWEASQKMETSVECSGRPAELCSSERYSDLTDDSSYLVQPIELSGPR